MSKLVLKGVYLSLLLGLYSNVFAADEVPETITSKRPSLALVNPSSTQIADEPYDADKSINSTLKFSKQILDLVPEGGCTQSEDQCVQKVGWGLYILKAIIKLIPSE